jgi:HD-like signal output (HDOD) protein
MNPTASDPLPGIHTTRFDELKALGQLPSPTGTALAILRLAKSDSSTIQQIARVLQTDPALAGRVLKIANSALSGGARTVFEVQDAVARLGIRQVRNVALGFSLISQNGKGKCREFDYQKYWSRSLATAVAAQAEACYIGQVVPGEAFTCGCDGTPRPGVGRGYALRQSPLVPGHRHRLFQACQ